MSDQESDASPPQPNFTDSFTLWPPTQRTREAIINRMIETLSTSSLLSKRYGTMSAEESSVAARQIEEEAFSVADAFSSSDKESTKIVEVYLKEISKRVIETAKARSSLADDGNATAITASPTADTVAVSDS